MKFPSVPSGSKKAVKRLDKASMKIRSCQIRRAAIRRQHGEPCVFGPLRSVVDYQNCCRLDIALTIGILSGNRSLPRGEKKRKRKRALGRSELASCIRSNSSRTRRNRYSIRHRNNAAGILLRAARIVALELSPPIRGHAECLTAGHRHTPGIYKIIINGEREAAHIRHQIGLRIVVVLRSCRNVADTAANETQ